jgi:hypothetical protein
MTREQALAEYNSDREMAFKRIEERFFSASRRRKEKLKWYEEHPSPLSAVERLRNIRAALTTKQTGGPPLPAAVPGSWPTLSEHVCMAKAPLRTQ